jgi:hypothetical protein
MQLLSIGRIQKMSSGIIQVGKLTEQEYLLLRTFINKTYHQCTDYEQSLRNILKRFGKLP